VWGALCGLLASVARRGWRPRLGVAAAVVTVVLFTVFEPK